MKIHSRLTGRAGVDKSFAHQGSATEHATLASSMCSCAIALMMAIWAPASAAQTVPGFRVETFAEVTDPRIPAFAANGDLFVGRDNAGSGGGVTDPVRIHRISADDLIVAEYGDVEISDPDTVIVDQAGVFGPAEAVLVGGIISNKIGGQIKSILPNQTVTDLFGPTTTFHNPAQYAFDRNGRLLFTNAAGQATPTDRGIFATSGVGDLPQSIYPTSLNLIGIAVDASGRILVATENGRIQTHQADGTLIDADFTLGLGSGGTLAIGTLGSYVDQLFTINGAGLLYVIDLSTGQATQLGEGFDGISSITFGPDGALYVAEFNQDRVLRVVPQRETLFSNGFERIPIAGT